MIRLKKSDSIELEPQVLLRSPWLDDPILILIETAETSVNT